MERTIEMIESRELTDAELDGVNGGIAWAAVGAAAPLVMYGVMLGVTVGVVAYAIAKS
jgi:hypothetical protein